MQLQENVLSGWHPSIHHRQVQLEFKTLESFPCLVAMLLYHAVCARRPDALDIQHDYVPKFSRQRRSSKEACVLKQQAVAVLLRSSGFDLVDLCCLGPWRYGSMCESTQIKAQGMNNVCQHPVDVELGIWYLSSGSSCQDYPRTRVPYGRHIPYLITLEISAWNFALCAQTTWLDLSSPRKYQDAILQRRVLTPTNLAVGRS